MQFLSFGIRTFTNRALLTLALGTMMLTSLASLSHAQVSIPALNTPVTEDFNTLASSGTSSILPAGWAFVESGTNANATYTAGTGSSNAGDTYSFGSTGSPERALGGLQSGTLIPTFGAQFQNNTGVLIRGLTITYTGEEWRLGTAGRQDRLEFEFSVDATSLTTGNWTHFAALDFNTFNTIVAPGALDGNDSRNRVPNITSNHICFQIETGATFWIRWIDFNASGADDGLAIDDFSISARSDPTTVNLAGPTTSLCGDKVSFTATVLPGFEKGSVEFLDGGTPVVSVNPNPQTGTAVASITGLSVGSHSITAHYLGGCGFAPSDLSNKIFLEISPTGASVTLSGPPTSNCGDKIDLIAELMPAGTTGDVEFFDGATSLGVATSDAGGIADLSVTGLEIGSHSFTAVFGGLACGVTSNKLFHDVAGLVVPLVLDAPPSSACGDKIVLHALVPTKGPTCQEICLSTYEGCIAGTGGDPDLTAICDAAFAQCVAACPRPGLAVLSNPAGVVDFFDGLTPLGSVPTDANGNAYLSVSELGVGQHSLTATFTAGGCYSVATSNKVGHEVTPLATSLTLDAPPSSSCGDKIVLHALMPTKGTTCQGACDAALTYCLLTCGGDPDCETACNEQHAQCVAECHRPGLALLSNPAGVVDFFDGLTPLGSVPTDANGNAYLSVTGLGAGQHSLTATFTAGGCYAVATSNKVLHDVTAVDVLIALAVSPQGKVNCGDKLTFSVSTNPLATGVAQLLDGANSIAVANLDANGNAVFSITTLGPGLHSVTASLAANGCFNEAASNKVEVTVSPFPTTVAMLAEPNPAKTGTKVTLKSVADPPGLGGSIEFFDGATSLGSVPVDALGEAVLSVGSFTPGSHVLTVTYTPDGCYAPSSSASYKLDVVPDEPPQVTVTSPNGGEILFIGSITKLAWVATDDNVVTSVDLYISRDDGATYEKIASGIPNTGTYDWIVTPPATNTGGSPVFSALFKVDAHDNASQTGTDASDAPFAIYDLATPALLSLFHAEPMNDGIELRWRLGEPQLFGSTGVERAPAADGPWTGVSAERRDDDGVMVMLDRSAVPGATYYYRVTATTASGLTRTFASLSATAAAAIKDYAITSITPNPSFGATRVNFAVPRESRVRMSVLDVSGREVAVLANGLYRPGHHQASWSGRTDRGPAPAGVYFIRYQTPAHSFVRRLALAR